MGLHTGGDFFIFVICDSSKIQALTYCTCLLLQSGANTTLVFFLSLVDIINFHNFAVRQTNLFILL